MGGKTWSRKEEILYWEELIPNSPKRLGRDLKTKKEKTWVWIARGMTDGMGADARRKYTPLCVCKSCFLVCCRRQPTARQGQRLRADHASFTS